jgi:hypothetical protein
MQMQAREYKIAFIKNGAADINDPVWKTAEPLKIDCFPWDNGGYKPNTEVRLISDGSRLAVLFETDEAPVLARYKNLCDPVHKDSCMEFFFRPDENDPRYMNFELNPFGTLYLGLGAGRGDGGPMRDADPAGLDIKTEIRENGWKLMFNIKFEFLKKYFKTIDFPWRANFYKCGDDKTEPSWGCWNYISAPKPDFHRPESFGILKL